MRFGKNKGTRGCPSEWMAEPIILKTLTNETVLFVCTSSITSKQSQQLTIFCCFIFFGGKEAAEVRVCPGWLWTGSLTKDDWILDFPSSTSQILGSKACTQPHQVLVFWFYVFFFKFLYCCNFYKQLLSVIYSVSLNSLRSRHGTKDNRSLCVRGTVEPVFVINS